MSTFVSFDLETTGLDPKNDAIIEIGLVRFDRSGVLERWSSLVNPGFSVSAEISGITGITDEMLADAPFFSNVRDQIVAFIGSDTPLIGHNVDFDASFFREYNIDLSGHLLIDTFRLTEFLFFREKSLNLGSLMESIGRPYSGQHRALADAEATAELYLHCLGLLGNTGGFESDVYQYISRIAPVGSALAYSIAEANLPMIENDPFAVVQSAILRARRERAPAVFFQDENMSVTWREILDNARKGSELQEWKTIEERPEQAKMLDLVTSTLNDRTLTMIEAPTGIGKTFAYGIPSILFSIQSGKQVFISTNTKTLQDQIVEKDMPAIHTLLDPYDLSDFSIAKVKGRSNYLSLLLFFEYLESGAFEETEVVFIAKILLWLLQTRDGELEELNFYGPEYGYLDRIRATDSRVLANENTYRKEEFLYTARQDAKEANIVIINHALLLSEMGEDEAGKILPPIRYLMIDEVHNLESVATDALRSVASLALVERSLEGIDSVIKKQKRRANTEPFVFPEFRNISESIVLNTGMLLDIAFRYFEQKDSGYGAARNRDVLLDRDFLTGEGIDGARRILDGLHMRLHELLTECYHANEELYARFDRHLSALEWITHVFDRIFAREADDLIKIVTYSDRAEISVSITPLRIGKMLLEQLYSSLEACVATSATLSVHGDFSYIDSTLSTEGFAKHVLASDFDYSRQALVYIPSDLGDVRNESDRKRLNTFIADAIRAIGGRTLGLFTSFVSIRETFAQIEPLLRSAGIDLLAQGLSGGKQKMLEAFKRRAESSALLGTDSFWEGVDIPGKDLELLIIHKFPFAVPTDPIFVARSRLYRNGFRDYSVPAMILKLRQGLGRLIRTKTDRGVIVLLDQRINSDWGATVRESFPEGIKIRNGTADTFIEMLRKKKGGGEEVWEKGKEGG